MQPVDGKVKVKLGKTS